MKQRVLMSITTVPNYHHTSFVLWDVNSYSGHADYVFRVDYDREDSIIMVFLILNDFHLKKRIMSFCVISVVSEQCLTTAFKNQSNCGFAKMRAASITGTHCLAVHYFSCQMVYVGTLVWFGWRPIWIFHLTFFPSLSLAADQNIIMNCNFFLPFSL